jgi:hypothetical protein
MLLEQTELIGNTFKELLEREEQIFDISNADKTEFWLDESMLTSTYSFFQDLEKKIKALPPNPLIIDKIGRWIDNLNYWIKSKSGGDLSKKTKIFLRYRKQLKKKLSEVSSDLITNGGPGYIHVLPNEPSPVKLKARFELSDKKGAKINLIRILNSVYELQIIQMPNSQIPSKEEFMNIAGEFFGVDLSKYDVNLSQAYNNGTLESNIAIFEEMKKRYTEEWEKRNK